MPIYQSLVIAYAKAIYMDGTKRFSQIRADYVESVKKYAATGIANDLGEHSPVGFNGYTAEELSNALTQGWITQAEYDQTLAYRV